MAIPDKIKQLANDIRTKIYGRDVRESLAQGIEEAGNMSYEALNKANNIQGQVDQLVKEGDSSVEAAQARVDAEGNIFSTLKERLDTKETQFAEQLTEKSQEIDKKLTEKSHEIEIINSKIDKIKFKDLSEPLYICHRGAANIFPENTLEAFSGCVTLGNPFVEMDVQTLADGSLGIMHDTTVNRTTNSTGNVADFSAMGFRNLTFKRSNLSGYNKTVTIPLFEDVVAALGKNAIYCPESKDNKSVQKIIDVLNKNDLKEYALIQSSSETDLMPAINAGYPCLLLNPSPSKTGSYIKGLGINYVGVPTTISETQLNDLLANGLKVIVYTIDRITDRDYWLSKGVSGFFSNDPFYLSESIPIIKKDPFNNGTFYHGMIAVSDRGGFISPNRYGFTSIKDESSDKGRSFCLQGWAGRLPDTFSLSGCITFDHIAKKWGSVAICTPKDYFDDNLSTLSDGYHILLGYDGIHSIYRIDKGEGTLLARGSGTTRPTEGKPYQFKIDVTASSVSLTIPSTGHKVTANDTKYRGGYLHFGRRYSAVSFSNITIT